jgi:predicted RNA-binding Zn-ribbon protein involved in translation (DUF1610 family)
MRDKAEWGTSILCPNCDEDTVKVYVVWRGDDKMHYNYKCKACGDDDRWQKLVRRYLNDI